MVSGSLVAKKAIGSDTLSRMLYSLHENISNFSSSGDNSGACRELAIQDTHFFVPSLI
jgi:hypothetical protein